MGLGMAAGNSFTCPENEYQDTITTGSCDSMTTIFAAGDSLQYLLTWRTKTWECRHLERWGYRIIVESIHRAFNLYLRSYKQGAPKDRLLST